MNVPRASFKPEQQEELKRVLEVCRDPSDEEIVELANRFDMDADFGPTQVLVSTFRK